MTETATTTRTYQWARRSPGVSADLVASVIQGIVDREGSCPPGRLVDAARDPLSPIHDIFEWDDRAAAERWRTHQARNIINGITITYVEGDRTFITPAFVSVGHFGPIGEDTDEDDAIEARPAPGYLRIGTALDDPALRRELLATAKSQLDGLRARYKGLTELAKVWAAIEGLPEE